MNKQDIDKVLARGRSETCGLDSEIRIKEGARVMLTTNINIYKIDLSMDKWEL